MKDKMIDIESDDNIPTFLKLKKRRNLSKQLSKQEDIKPDTNPKPCPQDLNKINKVIESLINKNPKQKVVVVKKEKFKVLSELSKLEQLMETKLIGEKKIDVAKEKSLLRKFIVQIDDNSKIILEELIKSEKIINNGKLNILFYTLEDISTNVIRVKYNIINAKNIMNQILKSIYNPKTLKKEDNINIKVYEFLYKILENNCIVYLKLLKQFMLFGELKLSCGIRFGGVEFNIDDINSSLQNLLNLKANEYDFFEIFKEFIFESRLIDDFNKKQTIRMDRTLKTKILYEEEKIKKIIETIGVENILTHISKEKIEYWLKSQK